MEVSDKHGRRLDEALKEDHSTRAQEFRRDQGPEDAQPVQADREFRPDVPQENEGVLDDRDADARADLARHLDPAVFPAHPDALAESAAGHFAPEWVIRALRGLPDGLYDNVQDVWRAMGGAVEERRA